MKTLRGAPVLHSTRALTLHHRSESIRKPGTDTENWLWEGKMQVCVWICKEHSSAVQCHKILLVSGSFYILSWNTLDKFPPHVQLPRLQLSSQSDLCPLTWLTQNSQTLKQNERKLRLFTPSFALLDEVLVWDELQNKILLLLSLAHSQSEWERHWDSLSGHIGKGSTFSQTTSITMYLTYFLLTAFPSSSCCAGEARISSLSSPLLSLLPAQMLEWCNEKDQRADLDGKINLQYFKKEKKKGRKRDNGDLFNK